MTFYAITAGYYSDYHIYAITADKNAAESLKTKCIQMGEEGCDIEEFEDGVELILPRYKVTFDKNGSSLNCQYIDSSNDIQLNTINGCLDGGTCSLVVGANNKEAAIKIAAEKRAKFLSEQMGL